MNRKGCVKVKRLEVLTVVLICGVVVSLIVNVVVLMENQKLRRLYDQVYQAYLSTIAPTTISPPISKPEAIHLALEYGRWNETTLKDVVVGAHLHYVKFFYNGHEWLYEVTEPVSDYSPVRIDDVTYRYVWVVGTQRVGPVMSIPPPGYTLYYVDAATGEVIPNRLYSRVW